MSTDAPPDSFGIPPAHYEDARNSAQNPPGPKAPIPVARAPQNYNFASIDAVINAADSIQRNARDWRHDPAWSPVYRALIAYQSMLADALVDHPGAFKIQFYQSEVKRVLGRKPGLMARILRGMKLWQTTIE